MSRIAKEPIVIPSEVEVRMDARTIAVTGPRGALQIDLHPAVIVERTDDQISVTARNGSKIAKAMSGTQRSLIANMVTGVTAGYEKGMVLSGTGYRARANGNKLDLSLGYSHPINYVAPDEINFEIKSESSAQVELVVRGIDKQVVGQVAANIRALRPPEPYKGKGIRYSDERIRRKQAKNVG